MHRRLEKSGVPDLNDISARLLQSDWVEFSGEAGTNRVRGRRRHPAGAENDAVALECWLDTQTNEHTRRAYRREGYRLMVWAVSQQRKAVSSLCAADMSQFLAWLAAPTRSAEWPAHWRLIEGPLKTSSQRQSRRILQGMFDFWVRAGYLLHNPLRHLDTDDEGHGHDGTRMRERGQELLDWVIAFVDTLPAATPCQRARIERLRFLLAWLPATHAQRADLAATTMDQLRIAGGECFCPWREQALEPSVFEALQRYRRSRGLTADPAPNETAIPLVAALDGKSRVEGLQIYSSLKWLFLRAAAQAPRADWAATLSAASTRWLSAS